MTEAELVLRRAIVATCREMNACGVNQGTSGNVSARFGDGLLLTPSSLPYEAMRPEDIILMAWDGEWQAFVPGRRPSSEWRFHRDILQARPDVGAVVHTHSTYATSLASHHRPIPAFHYMVAVAGGHSIRCAPYATFGTQELSDFALTALEGRKACLLGQHGQIALGTSPDNALWLAVEVEALARMYLSALTLGEPPVLSDAEMDNVLNRIARMGYGHSPDQN